MTDFRSNYYIDHTIETITMTQEIDIPLDLKRVVLMGAEETKLGDKKGALKQYRNGNLHIREYADKFTVHTDKVDPRTDPMGHLIHDAQEVLIGLAGAAISGAAIGSYIYKIQFELYCISSLATTFTHCIALGYSCLVANS